MAVPVNESCLTDPATGVKKGDTAWNAAGYLVLIAAASFARGQFEYTGSLAQNFYTRWDAWAGGGSGGEAVWFYWGAADTPVQEDDTTQQHYAVVLNDFQNRVEIRFDGVILTSTTTGFGNLDDSTWRTVQITVLGQRILVLINGIIILDYTDPTTQTLGGTDFGWGARNGGSNNEHRIRNLYVETPAPIISGKLFRAEQAVNRASRY